MLPVDGGLTDLREKIRANLGCPVSLGSLFLDFANSGGLASAINEILDNLANRRVTVLSRIGTDMLMLMEDPDFVLQLKKFDGNAGTDNSKKDTSYLCTPASQALVLLRGSGTKYIRRYEIDRRIDIDVFDPAARLTLVETIAYDGAVFRENLESNSVYEYAADHSFVMLRLAYKPFADQCWHFDSQSHQATFPSAGLMDQSALVNTAKVLGALGDASAIDQLSQLSSHPSHFVRWAAIQATGKLDRNAALHLLRAASTDTHPHIRSMSEKILARAGG